MADIASDATATITALRRHDLDGRGSHDPRVKRGHAVLRPVGIRARRCLSRGVRGIGSRPSGLALRRESLVGGPGGAGHRPVGRPITALSVSRVQGTNGGDLWATAVAATLGGTSSVPAAIPYLIHRQENACGDGTRALQGSVIRRVARRRASSATARVTSSVAATASSIQARTVILPRVTISRLCDPTCHFPTCGNL